MADDTEQTIACSLWYSGASIPRSNIAVHEVVCRRHKTRCQVCNAVILKEEQEQHALLHVTETCSYCSKDIPKAFIDQHRLSECPDRPKPCRFCELEFPPRSLPEHEYECGSRTDRCDSCGRYILLRELTQHRATCTGPPAKPQQQPVADTTTAPTGDSYDTIPCEYCGQNIPLSQWTAHEEQCLTQLAAVLEQQAAMARTLAHMPHPPPHAHAQQQQLQQSAMAPDALTAADVLGLLGPASAGTTVVRQRGEDSLLPGDFLRAPGTVSPQQQHQSGSPVISRSVNRLSVRSTTSSLPTDFLAPPGATVSPVAESQSPTGAADEEPVPCELCGAMVPFSRYTDHMSLHTRNTAAATVSPTAASAGRASRGSARRSSGSASLGFAPIEDPYDAAVRSYEQTLSGTELPQRQTSTGSRRSVPTAARTLSGGSRVSNEDDALIPCEVCGVAVPFSQYAQHEESCLSSRVGGLRDALLGAMAAQHPVPAAHVHSPVSPLAPVQPMPQFNVQQKTHTASADDHKPAGGMAMGIPVDSHIPMGIPVDGPQDYEPMSGHGLLGALFGLPSHHRARAQQQQPPEPVIPTQPPAWATAPPRPPSLHIPPTPSPAATAAAAVATTPTRLSSGSAGTSSSPVRRSPSGRVLMDPREAAAAGAAAAAAAPLPPRAAVYAVPGDSASDSLLAVGTADDDVGRTDMLGVAPGGTSASPHKKSFGSKVKGFFKRIFDRD